MKDKWPVAYKVAKNYSLTSDELNAMSGKVDLDGKTAEEVTANGSPQTRPSGRPGLNKQAENGTAGPFGQRSGP